MQVIDSNGNVFGGGIEITGPDGKPKTTGGGGGSPTGPAGGDLSGSYPNPGVVWTNGIPTYDLQYYPLSSNPAGYLTAISGSMVISALGYTPYDSANPAGYINSTALTPYLTSATAASTYYPLTNPSGYISGITSLMVTTALGFTPYDSTNPAGYITSAALSGYLTTTAAASTYYPLTNPNAYISGITGSDVVTALGYTPYDATNPAGYIDSSALGPYLTAATAATTYQPTLVSATNIKTINGNSILGSGDLTISGGGGNPQLLGFSGVVGTQTTGTTVTIVHSLLIPANTLGTNNILQVVFRMFRQSGNVGQMYGRIYFNTTNSLTGATLFNTTFTMNGGGTQYLGYVERNFSYNGTTLTSYSNAAYSEYTTGVALNVSFNYTVDNYILFTMQCQNSADIANINLFKVFAYV